VIVGVDVGAVLEEPPHDLGGPPAKAACSAVLWYPPCGLTSAPSSAKITLTSFW
jgi:hypothetical protein